MDTGVRSVMFQMYASNSTEMDFWLQMLVGFDLPRLDSNIFLIWKHCNLCFLGSETFF